MKAHRAAYATRFDRFLPFAPLIFRARLQTSCAMIEQGNSNRAPETGSVPAAARKLRLFGRDMPMPASRIGRLSLGIALVLGGMVGFLPILGFWMIPLGLLVLSHDFAVARRARRRIATWWSRRKSPA
jgi:hypothetical protein